MKDAKDNATTELLLAKRSVGRPPKPDALTPAQKQKAYRDRKRAEKEAAAAAKASKEIHSNIIDLSAATPIWRR